MWLDVVHAATGLVRSNWLLNAMQIGSRNLVNILVYYTAPNVCSPIFLLGVLFFYSFVKETICMFTPMMQCAWSITEVTRYGYHVLSELVDPLPRWAVLVRYSTFIVLYPAGFSGECLSILHVCS